eukprot:scaffold287206_cov37-Tisochrysis_lutea.AAC.3
MSHAASPPAAPPQARPGEREEGRRVQTLAPRLDSGPLAGASQGGIARRGSRRAAEREYQLCSEHTPPLHVLEPPLSPSRERGSGRAWKGGGKPAASFPPSPRSRVGSVRSIIESTTRFVSYVLPSII